MAAWNLKEGFRLGDYEVDPMGGTIQFGEKSERLEPKAIDVLLCLAARPGEVVERDTLAAEVWPGRFVSDDPISGRIAELRRALGDSAREPSHIETVPKRGYRLISKPERLEDRTASIRRWPRSRSFVLIGLLVVAAVAIGVLTGEQRSGLSSAESPATLAVIPFNVLSENADDLSFATGLTDVVFHRLSQSAGLYVTAKNSSFAYQGQSIDPVSVGRVLGAGMLVSGNVQSAPDGFRISIEIVSTTTGDTVWGDIVDAPADAPFSTQDRIGSLIVSRVREHLELDSPSSTGPLADANLEAYELYLLGRAQTAGPNAPDAIELFRTAIGSDPDFALAHAGLADALWQAAWNRDPDFPFEDTLIEAQAAADRAVQLGPEFADGYASQILFARNINDVAAAEAWFQKAIDANPGHVPAYIRFADVLQRSGIAILDQSQLDRAAALLNSALLLDPLNARLKQRRALLSHLRGNADALDQAKTDYYAARSSSEAIIALETMASIAGDLGSLDQAIAYLMIAARLAGEATGSISLEIAAHYLQLGELDQANSWLQRVPRPLDYYGAIQLATLYVETDQIAMLEALIEEVVAGSSKDASLPADFGAVFGIYFSESPLNCDRVFRYADLVDLPMLRRQGMAMPDMLLSLCYSNNGERQKAAEHRSLALEVGDQIDALSINDAFTFYEKAAIRAFARDSDDAVQYLEHAYDRGACFARVIERSAFLNVLDDDYRFIKLLSDFRSTNDRMRRNTFLARQNDDWYSLAGIEALD